MRREILRELKSHAPFTLCGAVAGIVFMLIFKNIPRQVSHNIFYVLHPMHVVLSALVTASMYRLHTKSKKTHKVLVLIIGYVGSVGIATLSDSIIPYAGEVMLGLPDRAIHLGFIEKWWLINPLAFMGIAIAFFRPNTKFPHLGHVLLSTWASLFHIMMAVNTGLNWLSYVTIIFFLFLAVWLPCCLSDIIFPLSFVRDE